MTDATANTVPLNTTVKDDSKLVVSAIGRAMLASAKSIALGGSVLVQAFLMLSVGIPKILAVAKAGLNSTGLYTNF